MTAKRDMGAVDRVTYLMDLPFELIEQVLLNLSTVDLGNLAMTCRQMRAWLDPKLAARLNRLIWANPNIVQVIRPQQPELYGITQRDQLASENLPDVEPLALRDNLRRLTEDLYACPMLAKYVKHVFIDYRKLNPRHDGFSVFKDVDHMEELMRCFKLKEHENEYFTSFWMSTCGLAAIVLLKVTNVESLVLVGCNSYCFEYDRDPITAALYVALTPGCQQKRLRSLKHIYAWGSSTHCQSGGSGHAPWEFIALPSLKTLECQDVCGPLPVTFRRHGNYDDHILRRALECDPVLHLETLVIRQQGLGLQSFFKILKYTPCLKRLTYQCISFERTKYEHGRGLHLARLRNSIQCLSHCLEELTIKVETMQDLWGFSYGDTDLDCLDNQSNDEPSIYDDDLDEDDCEDDDSEDDDKSDDTETDWKNELDSLDLTQESEELKRLYGHFPNLWTVQGIQNIPNVAAEDIQASLDRSNVPSNIREPSWDDHQPEFLGSLAYFTRLRNVAVPAMVLQDPWPYPGHGRTISAAVYSNGTAMAGARQHMKDLLPKSIERLTLFKLEGKNWQCIICLFWTFHDIESCHSLLWSVLVQDLSGSKNADENLLIEHLPNLKQDIQDVLETQALNFRNLIALEEKETPSCHVSADEERLWMPIQLRPYAHQ